MRIGSRVRVMSGCDETFDQNSVGQEGVVLSMATEKMGVGESEDDPFITVLWTLAKKSSIRQRSFYASIIFGKCDRPELDTKSRCALLLTTKVTHPKTVVVDHTPPQTHHESPSVHHKTTIDFCPKNAFSPGTFFRHPASFPPVETPSQTRSRGSRTGSPHPGKA